MLAADDIFDFASARLISRLYFTTKLAILILLDVIDDDEILAMRVAARRFCFGLLVAADGWVLY